MNAQRTDALSHGARRPWVLAAVMLCLACGSASAGSILRRIGTYDTGQFGASAAEIPAYDAQTRRLFVVNGASKAIDVLDLTDPRNPAKLFSIDISAAGSPNSVAVSNGVIAVAIEATNRQAAGSVAFYNAGGTLLNSVSVGALPDMLAFTPDGKRLLVANEGEPNSYNQATSVDPEGSVSIIDLSGGVASASVSTADFTSFNSQVDALRASGVRIFGPNASVAQDLEPEYIAVSSDSTKAFVTLQENNAIATIDLQTGQVTDIKALGFKDHGLAGQGIDASDRDNAINITTWPVRGMYQPDAIATYEVGGTTYLVTANEGDARDYTGFAEEARVRAVTLDPTAFPNASTLRENTNLGRLTITTANGDSDGDGDFDALYAFGSRSFSIWDEQGNLVWDSGDALEQITAGLLADDFNANNDANDSFDNRSDNKGPEPEGIAIGRQGNRFLAFIGLERIGGVMVYDITDPFAPLFLAYENDRDFNAPIGSAGSLGPEGLIWIAGRSNATGQALVVVANEVSGTVDIYAVVPEPSTLALLATGCVGLALAGRRRLRRAPR